MMDLLLRHLTTTLLLLSLCGFSTIEMQPQILWDQVEMLLKQALIKEKTSYQDAYLVYLQAAKKIEKIQLDFPEILLTNSITAEKQLINQQTFPKFVKDFLPAMKRRAEAEAAPLAYIPVLLKKSDPAFRQYAISKTLDHYVEKEEHQKAQDFIRHHLWKGIQTQYYIYLADKYMNLGLLERIPSLIDAGLNGIPREYPRSHLQDLVNIAKLLSATGKTGKAFFILDDAEEIARTEDLPFNRAESLASVAATNINVGRVRKGKALFNESIALMKNFKHAFPPRWASIVNALAQAREYDTAIKLSKERTGVSQVHKNLGLVAFHNGDKDQALKFLNEALEIWKKERQGALKDRKIELLLKLSTAFLEADDSKKAAELFEEAKVLLESEPFGSKSSFLRSELIKQAFHIGNEAQGTFLLNQWLSLISEMPQHHKHNTLNNLLPALISTNRLEEALAVGSMESDPANQKYLFAGIASEYADKGNIVKARSVFAEALIKEKEDRQNYHFKENWIVYKAKTYWKLGDTENAMNQMKTIMSMVEESEEVRWQTKTLVNAGRAFVEMGKWEIGVKVLQQASDLALSLAAGNKKREILERIALEFIKANEPNKATELAEYIHGTPEGAEVWDALASWYATKNRQEMALRFLPKIQQSCAPKGCWRLKKAATTFIEIGEFDPGKRLIELNRKKEDQIALLCKMAEYINQKHGTSQAESIYSEALDLATSIEGLKWKIKAKISITKSMRSAGKARQAHDLLTHLVQDTHHINWDARNFRNVTANQLMWLIRGLIEIGETAEAYEAAMLIPNDTLRAHLFIEIAGAWRKTGNLEKGERLVQQATDIALDTHDPGIQIGVALETFARKDREKALNLLNNALQGWRVKITDTLHQAFYVELAHAFFKFDQGKQALEILNEGFQGVQEMDPYWPKAIELGAILFVLADTADILPEKTAALMHQVINQVDSMYDDDCCGFISEPRM